MFLFHYPSDKPGFLKTQNNRQRFKVILTLYFVLALSLTGCSGIIVSQDYYSTKRFPELKTYAWKSETQEKTGDIRVDSPFIDSRFRNAMDKIMKEKGFQKTSRSDGSKDAPDFLVAYHYSIRPKITSSPSGPSFGFGIGSASRHSAFGFSSETVDVTQYDEGFLVIDFSDSKDGSLLWRGLCSSRIDTHLEPQDLTHLFTQMVKKNLEQFPPKP